MVRSLRGVVSRIGIGVAAGALVLSVAAAGGVAGAATKAVPGGNASGGALAKTASKVPLIGAKGTGLTRGITSTSISVGCVYTSADYAGYVGGIQAAFYEANLKGIDGRKITLVPCKDDTGGVQSNVSEVEQLVQQNQVFALLSLTEYILPGSTNFLSTNQVPYYGWGFNPGFCGYRWGFGWNGCLSPVLLPTSNPLHNVDEGNLATAIIKASGLPTSKVRFAVQAENSPSGTSGNADYDSLFKALGAKVVYSEANFPLTVTGIDFTPYVQAIMAAKPNIVFISTPFADVGGMASALKAAGYKGITMDFVTYSPGLLGSSAGRDELGVRAVGAGGAQGQWPAALPHPRGVDRLRRGHRVGRAASGRGQEPQHQDVRHDRQRRQVRQLQDDPGRRTGSADVAGRALHSLRLRCHCEGERHGVQRGEPVQVLHELHHQELARPVTQGETPGEHGHLGAALRRRPQVVWYNGGSALRP